MSLKNSSYMEEETTLIQVRKDLQRSCSSVSYSDTIQQAMSSLFLNISEDPGSTVSLGSLLQCLVTFMACFSYIERFNFIFLCYVPDCICFVSLSICTAVKFDSVFSSFLHDVLVGSPQPLFFRINTNHSFSNFPHGASTNLLNSLDTSLLISLQNVFTLSQPILCIHLQFSIQTKNIQSFHVSLGQFT